MEYICESQRENFLSNIYEIAFFLSILFQIKLEWGEKHYEGRYK